MRGRETHVTVHKVQQCGMSDSTHLILTGCVQKQKLLFWASQNPMKLMEIPLQSYRVIIWNEIIENVITCPFFIECSYGQTTTVNGVLYSERLSEYFIPAFERMNLADPYFKQDGNLPHQKEQHLFPESRVSWANDLTF